MSTAKEVIDEAIDQSDAGKYGKAHKLLNKAIKLDPSFPQAYFERAIVLLNLEKDQDALSGGLRYVCAHV